jgi:hypothetical protein
MRIFNQKYPTQKTKKKKKKTKKKKFRQVAKICPQQKKHC